MSENTIITINNVKLSRGMTVDYEKGDPVINSVFKIMTKQLMIKNGKKSLNTMKIFKNANKKLQILKRIIK